jgi:hypothetical protein
MLQISIIEPKNRPLESNATAQQVRSQILQHIGIEPHFLTVKESQDRFLSSEEIDKVKLAIKFLKAAPSNENLAYDCLTMQYKERIYCKVSKQAITAEIENCLGPDCQYIELAYCLKSGAMLMQVRRTKYENAN